MSSQHVWTAVVVALAVLGFSAPSLTHTNTGPVTHASRIGGLLKGLGQCTVTADGPRKSTQWETENR